MSRQKIMREAHRFALYLVHYVFILSSLLPPSIAYRKPHSRPIRIRGCGTANPSKHLVAQHQWLHINEDSNDTLWNATMIRDYRVQHHTLERRTPILKDFDNTYQVYSRQIQPALYTIDTYMHVVTDSSSALPSSKYYVTDQMIDYQIAYLNNAYASAGIAYRHAGSTRTINDTWARNGDDIGMKRVLRRGTYASLNIYYQTLLQAHEISSNLPTGSYLLGFCTLPSPGVTSSTPRSAYIQDGCNILSGTLPGSWLTNYNQGGTTAHEVGHWNGLLHTFQNTNCDPTDWGDYVADTPQESVPTNGCPSSKDSCPRSGIRAGSYDGTTGSVNPYTPQGYAGPDPIGNFMDYSSDACYDEFTPGQSARMVNMWVIFRQGR